MEVTRPAINSYLHYCKTGKRLSAHTLRAYRIDLEQLLAWMEKCDSSTLDRTCLQGYLAHLNCCFAASSVKRKIASVRAFAAHRSTEQDDQNPFSSMRISIREPQRLPRTITSADLLKLFAARKTNEDDTPLQRLLSVRDQAILELLIATGMRVSELCHLDLESYSMRDSLVRILGKGSKERLAHLESPVTREALQSYLKIRGTLLNPSEARSSESPLFLNRFGNRISEQSVRAIVRNRAHRAGVTAHITPHMFRHTFATMLLEDNVNLRYIQSFLGHSSVKTTERYTHVAQVRQREILRNHNPREIIDRNMRNALLG